MLEKIEFDGTQYAIIVRSEFRKPGIHFFTPDDFSQQLAYMSRPQGYVIQPHFHRIIKRQISLTQEVLLIKRGRLRVDFYNKNKKKVGFSFLESGDVILLIGGGHGFEMLEECEIFEVKQGPYTSDDDKVKFSPE